MSTPNRRKCITIEEKNTIIKRLESGISNAAICKEFGIGHSTVSSIWKNRNKIEELVQRNVLTSKRIRQSTQIQIDRALLQWTREQQNQGIALTTPMLQKRAQFFAVHLNMPNYVCTTSWINRFKVRHNLGLGKAKPVNDWLKNTWPNVRAKFTDKQIFIACECDLFYRRNDLADRLSVIVAADMTGTQKHNLLAIAKIDAESVDTVLDLKYSEAGTISDDVFAKWLQVWDKKLAKTNDKILLLVYNSNYVVSSLNNITLECLPSSIKTLHDVIKDLKANLISLYQKHTDIRITLSDAWNNVESVRISNCFKRAGLLININEDHNAVREETLSKNEALKAAETLRVFVKANFNDDVKSAMTKVYNAVQHCCKN